MGAHAPMMAPGIALSGSHACKRETSVYSIKAIKSVDVCWFCYDGWRVCSVYLWTCCSTPHEDRTPGVWWYRAARRRLPAKHGLAEDRQAGTHSSTRSVTSPSVACVCGQDAAQLWRLTGPARDIPGSVCMQGAVL
jgi:hypothetical protein